MRRIIRYALVLLPVLPTAVQAQKPSNSMQTRSAEIYLKRAESAAPGDEMNELLTKALEVLMDGVENDPANPRIWFMAGQAYARMGDVAGADSAFDKAESMYPDYADEIEPERLNLWINRYNAGVTALQSDDRAQAMAAFEAADRVYRGRPEAVLMLGSLRTQSGDLPGAEEAYRTALDITLGPAADRVKPDDREKWQEQLQSAVDRLGSLLSQLGRHDDAIATYREVLEKRPGDATLKAALAAELAMAGQTEAATAMYEELLAGGDLSDVAWFNAGVRLYSAEQPELAAKAFRKAVAVNPYSRDGWYNLGQALFAMSGRIEDAGASATESGKASLDQRVKEVNEELLTVAQKINELDPAFRNSLMMKAQALRTLSELTEDAAAKKERQDGVVEALQAAEAMKFEVGGIQYRMETDHVTVSGRLTNLKLSPGEKVTLNFALLGESGDVLATHRVDVAAGDPESSTRFDFEVPTDVTVVGWRYSIES